MLLKDKNAVIYAGAGAVGSAIARRFAQEGARVFVTGRRLAGVEAVARDIVGSGGFAHAAEVDAIDEPSVEAHMGALIDRVGSVDISFNAIGVPQPGVQGSPLVDLPLETFLMPITTYARSHFITARAAARRMLARGSGVVLMHVPEPGRIGAPLVGGMGPAWAAMEALSRDLSAELAAQGVRAIVLRTTGMPETATIDTVFGLHARAIGISSEQFREMVEGMSHHRRSTTLQELANAAAFAGSDWASGMTGAIINLTAGKVVD